LTPRTGMRNAELRHLKVGNIDSRRMLIHIQRRRAVAVAIGAPCGHRRWDWSFGGIASHE